MNTPRTVSFLSDYGTTDEFVGVVHSVLAQLAPAVRVVDVCHEIPPYDLRAGSLTLARAMQYLAPGVVLAVVDPGVGTDRRAVAVELTPQESKPPNFVVGPDNGLLAPAVAMGGGAVRAVVLDDSEFHLASPGPTFAGRDVFAPAAAYLATGTPLTDLGSPLDPLELVPALMPLPRVEGDRILGEVLWADRYGNLQVNVDPVDLDPFGPEVAVVVGDGRRIARRVGTFADLGGGGIGLIIDSYGMLALVADRSSAAESLGIGAGDPVAFEAVSDSVG